MNTSGKFISDEDKRAIYVGEKTRVVKYPSSKDAGVTVYELQSKMGDGLYHTEKRLEVKMDGKSDSKSFTPLTMHVVVSDIIAVTEAAEAAA